ncbi:TPA: VUT family protein [Legionella feeleii]|uniref:Conserved hypothetical integral membrane protein n=1 Tax=Legionella feeleii TaxID=453 RepID=A0A378IY93_9GAMM|nr:conserved hypothetical integral membrane protein [Legionella feeleii]
MMTIFSTALQKRSYLPLTVGMMTCLILLINVSFKIIMIQGLIFTASAVLCPLVAFIYLLVLNECNVVQQRHILNQSLLALYLFSVGIYLLVNLPAAETMYDNPAYQIVFEDIPKKFFASTLAFGLSFYLPHMICCARNSKLFASPRKCLLMALLGGFSFFSLDFVLLFSDPHIHSFNQIYLDSSMLALTLLLLIGIVYLVCLLFSNRPNQTKQPADLPQYLSFPLYHYLVSFSVAILLICLACEYRLVSFPNGWALTASGLLFPLTMMASSLIGELYGYKANLRLIIVLLITQLVFDFLLMGAVALPSPDFFNLNPFYSLVMPRQIPAASLALFVNFVTNASLLEYLKKAQLVTSRYSRILIANICATTLICIVNYSLLYAGIYPHEQIFTLAITYWLYKLIATLIGLPLILWLCNQFHKQMENSTGLLAS